MTGTISSTAHGVQTHLDRYIARIASATPTLGASLVGVADEGGLFTGTTVEAVLAELAAGVGITDVTAAAATTLTIAAGVVTATQTYHTIDTEGAAASDDLDTINGLANGQFYVFKSASAARNVVFKHNTGNIKNPSGRDITLDVTNDKIFGFSDGTSLFVFDMSLATPTGGGIASALASVSASQGASLVGVQDSGSLYTATTVEAALAEVRTSVLAKPATELTIATGAITVTQSYHKIDTEADAGTDDLDTITGIVDGQFYVFRNDTVGRSIVFRSGIDTIICPGNFNVTLAAAGDTVLGFGYGGFFVVLGFITANLAGGGLGLALSSSATGQGASRVGIEDSLSLITATNVETALAEIVKYETVLLADPGTGVAIPVTRSATVNIVTSAAETNTLAIPTFTGQRLLLNMDTRVGGDRVVTSSQRINQAGNTIMTFGAAGDCIQLGAIKIAGAFRWQVLSNDGVALS